MKQYQMENFKMGEKKKRVLVSSAYLDELWRKVIRLMFSYRCAKCKSDGRGNKDGHDAHHVVMRADRRHRWHPLNGVLLCFKCHAWAHKHPRKFTAWLKRHLPEVYKSSRTKGFEGRDNQYIKDQLIAMQFMMGKIARGGFSEQTIMPLITLLILVGLGIWYLLTEY